MSFNFSPKIVTDGLKVYLDAGNPKSYVSGSTTWTDISRGDNNGTLINGPTFSSGNGGSIIFDGNDDKLTNNSLNILGNSPITLSYWGKMLTNQSGDRVMIIYGNDGVLNQVAGIYYRNSDNYVRFTAWGGAGVDFATSFIKDFNIWHKWDLVYNGSSVFVYRDGVLDGNGSQFRSINFTANRFQMGYIIGTGLYSNTQVSNIQIYNRALSATEVLQNYNATKSRFI